MDPVLQFFEQEKQREQRLQKFKQIRQGQVNNVLSQMSGDVEFNRRKAESVIKYMADYIENVEEDDLTVEEVAEFLKPVEERQHSVGVWAGFAEFLKPGEEVPEDKAREILDYAAEDNSRLKYSDDDVYEIAKILRKRNTGGEGDKDQPLSLNEKKAAAILDYLLRNCCEFEEGDFTADEIAWILDTNQDTSVKGAAESIFNAVQYENSRFEYSDDDVYELTRIIRKRRM